MSRVIHFEIHADNPERGVRFYTQLFNWQFKKWDGPMPYWLISTGPDNQPGINGGLLQRPCPAAAGAQGVTAFVCTVGVDSLDSTLQKLTSLGGQIAVPKMPVPGVGWLAYGKDTEGNTFGMMQADPGAR
jgi:predicted enzyme related to lactoylglutathione lyase